MVPSSWGERYVFDRPGWATMQCVNLFSLFLPSGSSTLRCSVPAVDSCAVDDLPWGEWAGRVALQGTGMWARELEVGVGSRWKARQGTRCFSLPSAPFSDCPLEGNAGVGMQSA